MKIRNRKTVSESKTLHGGMIRFPGPYPRNAEADAETIRDTIEEGVTALENQTSRFAADVEPAEGAKVYVFDFVDVATGDSVVVWRIECRPITRH
jgi:hypothetical protein